MSFIVAYDENLQLVDDVADFDDGDDAPAGHTHVLVEPSSTVVVELKVNGLRAALGNADNTLLVWFEVSPDGGSTYYEIGRFINLTNAMIVTAGQNLYTMILALPPTGAGETELRLRAHTTAAGQSINLGTCGIRCGAIDFPARAFPSGVVGFDTRILPTRLLK